MRSFIARLTCVGAAGILSASLGTALAQTAATPASAPASQPSTAVAVQPKTAAVAADKAVPRSDVATVVRTGPSAADKAREMTGRPKPHAKQAKHPDQASSAAMAASATGNQ